MTLIFGLLDNMLHMEAPFFQIYTLNNIRMSFFVKSSLSSVPIMAKRKPTVKKQTKLN